MNQFSLYSYYRSSCSYRVRIALAHKNISYNYIPVHLVQNGGEQFSKAYSEINPKNEVPTLIHGKNSFSQSMAIFNYLDAVVPENLLFPSEKCKRAKVIEFCEIINSGIQPLQNL
ncbi:MAG: glutathione S-transferase N-terminal domain-containing protein, partial [Flavobacteriales bacterium]|nr:glutathione S-transferase N-terminal domain-containing protein [Flavobacteriales bacterium]